MCGKGTIIHENNNCHYTHTYILYLYLPNGAFQEQLFKLLKLLITIQLKLIIFKESDTTSICLSDHLKGWQQSLQAELLSCISSDFKNSKNREKRQLLQGNKGLTFEVMNKHVWDM